MGYNLCWRERQIERDARRYSNVGGLREEIEKQLESMENQIKWYSEPGAVGKRFHNVFSLNGLNIGEMRFGMLRTQRVRANAETLRVSN